MCVKCLARIGLQTTSLLCSRTMSTATVPRPQALRESPNGFLLAVGRSPLVEQHRQMSLLYFILKNHSDARRARGQVKKSPFTMRYGIEGAIARELISFGAKVHFTNGKWYGRKTIKSWRFTNPGPEATGYTINAIDCTDSFVNQGAIDNVVRTLDNVKYLSLDGCKYVDDHVLASLVQIRDSLTHLSINRCNQITDGGLANLHRLRNLERLNINDLPLVTNTHLVAIMLEDVMPKLKIGMVTEQIELYKKSIFALEDPDKHLKRIQETVSAMEEKVGDEESAPSRTEDAEWGHLISEKPDIDKVSS